MNEFQCKSCGTPVPPLKCAKYHYTFLSSRSLGFLPGTDTSKVEPDALYDVKSCLNAPGDMKHIQKARFNEDKMRISSSKFLLVRR